MRTPISQSTAKTNAKKYNDYFNANYQTYKPMKPTTPYTIRISTSLLPKEKSKDEAKELRKRLKIVIEKYLKKIK